MHDKTITISKDRRLRGYAFGWMIEIRKINSKTGEEYWEEDRPAYPPNLETALEYCLERETRDKGDCDISELSNHFREALRTLRDAEEQAREVGRSIKETL